MSFGDRTEPCCTRTGLVQTRTVKLGSSFGDESQGGQASLECTEESRLGVDLLEEGLRIRCKVLHGERRETLESVNKGHLDKVYIQGTNRRANGCLAECVLRVLQHLSRALDVHITKILVEGMRVTTNDSVRVFGSKRCLSNRRGVRWLACNILHVLVLSSCVLVHGVALQLPHLLRGQVPLHERLCELHG